MVDSVQEKKVAAHPPPEAAPAEEVEVQQQQVEEQPEQSATEYTEGQKPSAPRPGFRMNPLFAGKPAASAAAEEAKDEDFLPIPDEFTPPESADLVDHIRAARHEGIPLEASPEIKRIVIRRFGDENAVNGGDDRLDTADFGEYRSDFQRWLDDFADGCCAERYSTNSIPGNNPPPNPASSSRLPERMLVDIGGNDNTPVSIDPIVAYIDAEVGRMRLTVVDHITGETLYQKELDGFDSDPSIAAGEVKKTLAGLDPKEEIASLPKPTPDDLKRWEDKWTIRPAKTGEVAGASDGIVAEEWSEFDRKMGIDATPAHLEWDRVGRYERVGLEIDRDVMEKAGNVPIVIRSRGGIMFGIEKKEGDHAVAASHEGAGHFVGLSGNRLATSTPGVYIREEYHRWSIWIPQKFATDEDAPDFAPIELDLSPLGLPEIKHTFYQEVKKPVGSQGEYTVYADGGKELYEANIGDIEAIADAAGKTEEEFGLKEGAIVSRLYIPDTHDRNLQVFDKSEIIINDESLEFTEEAMEVYGRHEAIHSCDFHFKISEDNKFVELHKELTNSGGKLFGFIDEKNMYDWNFGGHSADNELELFASLVNSVYCPNLKDKLDAASPALRRDYYSALETARKSIVRAHMDYHMIRPVEMGLPMPKEVPPAPPVLGRIEAVLSAR